MKVGRRIGGWQNRVAMAFVLMCAALKAYAGPFEQAKRMHDRLAGVPPSEAVLNVMAQKIAAGKDLEAAHIAMDNDAFYRVTLKNWVAPWTNRDENVFVPLNDYIATVMGLTMKNMDFRQVLQGDIVFVGENISPAYAANNNAHYEALENANVKYQQVLVQRKQSELTTLPASAAAGVLTSRAAAKAFFINGTNRAQLRFTLKNFLCHDLEQLHDVTRVPDRIRQDVSRSPGGDARLFLNGCLGCHSGMDPLAQAFAYYDFKHDADQDLTGEQGYLVYNQDGMLDPKTASRVQAKYWINSTTFPYGYITQNDHWDNYWRAGINQHLGWSAEGGSGDGAASLGAELANSKAFAQCQAEKVFKAVCLQPPKNQTDRIQVAAMVNVFTENNRYQLKDLFASAAAYCKGD